MRWLLLKDLRLLGRSRLLVATLALYPVVLALLLGLLLSGGPQRPAVAVLNEIPAGAGSISLGGRELDLSEYSERLEQAVEPVEVPSRAEALRMVRDGDVLAALIVPADVADKLEAGLEPATIEVLYSGEDPVKARYVQDVIKSQVQDANLALTQRFTEAALEYIDLIGSGGRFSVLGQTLDVLGLERSAATLESVLPALSGPDRAAVERVIAFAELARENLTLANGVLESVGEPIRVDARAVEGRASPLSGYAAAVVLTLTVMLVALLLAASSLAAERDEGVYERLVRGLVPPLALVVEKVLIGAICAAAVGLLMLIGLVLVVGIEPARPATLLVGLGLGSLAFAALGTALGALARELRAASLIAFMTSLPIAFLALVPAGTLAAGPEAVAEGLTALFPFGPMLDAVDAGVAPGGSVAPALAHLAALTVAFSILGRLALRRLG